MNAVATQMEQAERTETVCWSCHKVAWNGIDGTTETRWLDAEVYESRIGAVSHHACHSMCPDCIGSYWENSYPGTEGPSPDIAGQTKVRF